MYKDIEYEKVISGDLGDDYLFIDVRSPKEFEEDTVPGAINLPIFNNEERELVGTSYKQDSVENARELGINIVSKKLPSYYKELAELKKSHKNLVFLCARGGYRSSSVVSFLQSIGHKNIWKLHGGYKHYRQFVNHRLEKEMEKISFIVLYGNTGSGKTKILKSLEEKGADILDLEGYANHRGSTLGGVGLNEQFSQKKFESLVLDKLINRTSNLFFIEGESRRIGKVIIPESIFEKMMDGLHIKIDTDLDMRVSIILEDYINGHNDEIIEALHYLRKRLGNDLVDNYIERVKNDDFAYVARELMLNYYDPMYEHHNRQYVKVFKNTEIDKTADDLIEWSKSL